MILFAFYVILFAFYLRILFQVWGSKIVECIAKWGQKYKKKCMSSFDQFKNYISDWCGRESCFCSSCKFEAVLSHAWIVSCFITYFICIICVCLLFIWSNLLLWSYLLFMWSYLLLWYDLLVWSYLLFMCSYLLFMCSYLLLYAHIWFICTCLFKKMLACIYVIVGFKSFM